MPVLSPNRFFKAKADIQQQFSSISSSEVKHGICSLDGNSKRNWTNKTDIASVDRLEFRIPPTHPKANAEILREFSQIIVHEDKHKICSFDSNSQHNWINKALAPSLDRPYYPPTHFSRQCWHSVNNSVSLFPPRTSIKYVQ